MDLNTKLSSLKRCDLNCNVFDVYSYDGLSLQELLCQFFTKINECIKVSNETIDLASWLVNEGLKKEVVEKLMLWLNDGTLENLINVNLFNTLHTKIDIVNKERINVKLFGCKGDGVTDDTQALKNIISNLKDNDTLVLNGDFLVSEMLVIKDVKNLKIEGQGGLKANNLSRILHIENCENITLKDIYLNGLRTCGIGVNISNCKKSIISNLYIYNFQLNDTCGGVRFVKNCSNSIVDGCKIENIIGDRVAYGILFEKDEVSNHSEHVIIKNCFINNIQPSDDGDGIKFLQQGCNNYTTIENCTMIDCHKRAIKIQGFYNKIINCVGIGYMSYTGFDFQSGYGEIINSELYFSGATYTGVVLKNKDCLIDGLKILSDSVTTNSKGIFIEEGFEGTNGGYLKVKNLEVDGFYKTLEFRDSITANYNLVEFDNIEIKNPVGQYPFISTSKINIDLLKVRGINITNHSISNFCTLSGFVFNDCVISDNITHGQVLTNFGIDRDKSVSKLEENGNGYYLNYKQEGNRRVYYDYRKPSVGQSFQHIYKKSKLGDVVINTQPTKLGEETSGYYYIKEWLCVEDSDGTNSGTWVANKIYI